MYKIISENSIEKLSNKVNEMLKHPDRWTVLGGISIEGDGKKTKYLQTMTREITTPLMDDTKSDMTYEHALIMIKAGADVNASDKQGITPLMFASAFSKLAVVKELIQHKANINARDEEGNTPLFWAVSHSDNQQMVKFLIESGSDVNSISYNGRNILMAALSNTKNSGIIKTLIDCKANINATMKDEDIEGVTPLMLALAEKHPCETIKRLLEKGADINAKDSHGKTPWAYAILANSDEEILNLLKEYGANTDFKI